MIGDTYIEKDSVKYLITIQITEELYISNAFDGTLNYVRPFLNKKGISWNHVKLK